MELSLTQNQLNFLIKHSVNQRLKLHEQDVASANAADAQPTTGTSDKQAGGQGYPDVGKWESGVTRGPGNQVGITKWSDVVGSKVTRGKANPLKEQGTQIGQFQMPKMAQDATYVKKPINPNTTKIKKLTKNVYKLDDGESLYVNLKKGEFSEALLDLRSIMFSGWGLFTQVVVGLVGSEIGAPIALELIDDAIILNDIYIFIKESEQGDIPQTPKGLNPKDSFVWLLHNSQSFERVVQDIMIVATMGAVRSTSGIIKYFEKNSNSFAIVIQYLRKISSTIKNSVGKIPGQFGKSLTQKSGYVDAAVKKLEEMKGSSNVYVRSASKLPTAVYVGALSALGLEIGMNTLGFLLGSKVKPNDQEFAQEKSQEVENLTTNVKGEMLPDRKKIEDQLYKKIISLDRFVDLPRENFKLSNEKYKNEDVLLIFNKKYYITPSNQIVKI